MSINKVALIGATGNIGAPVLKALLDNDFEVTVLSREGSTSTDSLASHPRQKIIKVNFDDVNSITSALQGVEGVVSNVAAAALLSQKQIIDAAIAAGVKRFIPSQFGSDLSFAANRTVPFNQPKIEVESYLIEKSKAHPEFSWTALANGPFLDWCLYAGMFGNIKTHETTLWDGGETKFSTTTQASVGKAVAGVFKNLEGTKNQELRIADTTITLKQIMGIVKEIDGKEWTTKTASTTEAYQAALDEMKKPDPNIMVIIMNQLYLLMFNDQYGPHFGKPDNDKVGLTGLTDEQVKEIVKSAVV